MTFHDLHVSLLFRRVHSSQPELQTSSWLQAVGEGRQTVFAGEPAHIHSTFMCSTSVRREWQMVLMHTHTAGRFVDYRPPNSGCTTSALAVDAMSISYRQLVQITLTRILFKCSSVNLTAGIETQQPRLAISLLVKVSSIFFIEGQD